MKYTQMILDRKAVLHNCESIEKLQEAIRLMIPEPNIIWGRKPHYILNETKDAFLGLGKLGELYFPIRPSQIIEEFKGENFKKDLEEVVKGHILLDSIRKGKTLLLVKPEDPDHLIREALENLFDRIDCTVDFKEIIQRDRTVGELTFRAYSGFGSTKFRLERSDSMPVHILHFLPEKSVSQAAEELSEMLRRSIVDHLGKQEWQKVRGENITDLTSAIKQLKETCNRLNMKVTINIEPQ